jgi:hypothetical protein
MEVAMARVGEGRTVDVKYAMQRGWSEIERTNRGAGGKGRSGDGLADGRGGNYRGNI